jgi:nucleoside-diphosphate-sugar epimerase
MNVLFIGGNGNIGWWCAKLASELGSFNVFALTTGRTAKSRRSIPENITKWNFEVENSTVLKDFIVRHNIEVVCDFIAYDEDAVKQRHRDLRGYIKQYIFISTVSVYERKTSQLPFKESAKKWSTVEYPYATNKILAERYLEIVASKDFAVTIVRPAHTYDTIVPAPLGHNCFTVPQRLIEGKPLLIPGDGTNIWALCHSRDFASAFVRLIGNSLAFNEDFHITGEEWLTWIEIGLIMSKALGRDNIQVINVPISEIIGMKLPTSQNIKTPYWAKFSIPKNVV